jgi:hypothetical protein
MSDLMKIRLLAMLDEEIKEVEGSISNNRLWMLGSDDEDDMILFQSNINDLEEYKETLQKMRTQVMKGEFNV